MKDFVFPKEYMVYLPAERKFLKGESIIARGIGMASNGQAIFAGMTPTPVVFCWFSGLYDIGKNKIYEGHICKFHLKTDFGSLFEKWGVMKWQTGRFMFYSTNLPEGQVFETVNIEIKGHELENPELLAKI